MLSYCEAMQTNISANKTMGWICKRSQELITIYQAVPSRLSKRLIALAPIAAAATARVVNVRIMAIVQECKLSRKPDETMN